MKILITLLFLSYVLPCSAIQKSSGIERELSRITGDFKEAIMDEDKCEDLKNEAEDIADQIKELLKKTEDFSFEEISKLKQLKIEAEEFEDFIAVVAGVGSAFPKLKAFLKANEVIKADIYYISKEEQCIDILVVEIDEYKAYLAINNSSKNFTLNYEWKTKDGSSYGNSKSGMASNSIRHMLNSRDSRSKYIIDFKNINCQEF